MFLLNSLFSSWKTTLAGLGGGGVMLTQGLQTGNKHDILLGIAIILIGIFAADHKDNTSLNQKAAN